MKKDFYKYYTKVQLQYNETLKILEKINKELEEGLCTQEQRDNFERYFNNIQTNYERLSYVRHLLTLPPKFIQKLQEKKIIKEQERLMNEFKKNLADQESVISENQENIDLMNSELGSIIDRSGGSDNE